MLDIPPFMKTEVFWVAVASVVAFLTLMGQFVPPFARLIKWLWKSITGRKVAIHPPPGPTDRLVAYRGNGTTVTNQGRHFTKDRRTLPPSRPRKGI